MDLCCQRFVGLCCPCLASSKHNREEVVDCCQKFFERCFPCLTSSKAGAAHSQNEDLVENGLEPLPGVAAVGQMLEFPDGQHILPSHPQMFVMSTSNSSHAHPKPKPISYSIGHRQFGSARDRASVWSECSQQAVIEKPHHGLLMKKLKDKLHTPLHAKGGHKNEPIERPRSVTDIRTPVKKYKSPLIRRMSLASDAIAYSRSIPSLFVLEDASLTEDPTLPLLQFTLLYDILKGTLTVHLHHACNLPVKEKKGTVDPFVVLFLMPNKEDIFESKVISQTVNPIFDESFDFKFHCIVDNVVRQTLNFRIYDDDKHANRGTIGSVDLHLNEDDVFGMVLRMQVHDQVIDEDSQGDLMLALCYDFTLSYLKGVVLKATNLKKRGISSLTGLSDTYIRIHLYDKGGLLHTWKSSTKPKTLSPVFNENFQFDISGKDISNIVMEVDVMHHDHLSLSKDDILGKIVFGSMLKGGSQFKHWKDMISSSPQLISQWHSIQRL